MNITTHQLPARQAARPVLVQANEPYPGLRVYLQPEELRTANDLYVWSLAHHSGRTIAVFEYPGDADDAAWAIRELADWTRSADQIRADLDGDTVRAALERSPGIFLSSTKAQEATQ